MQSGALLTEAGFRYVEGQQVSPPRCFYFLAVLFSTAFFLTGVARAIRDRDATFSGVLLCRFSIFSLGDAKFAQKRQIKTCRLMFFSARK